LTRYQGNLLNRHSHKYSGLANSKVVNIYATPEGSIAITKVKKDAKPNQVGLRVIENTSWKDFSSPDRELTHRPIRSPLPAPTSPSAVRLAPAGRTRSLPLKPPARATAPTSAR
jgi:hypothetical protein